jgi:hypothetical protein
MYNKAHTPGRAPLNDLQLILEATTYTTQQTRQTSIPSAGYEPTIPVMKHL